MKLTKKDRIRNAVCAAVSILAFLTIWQLATMFSHLGELIPSPIEVVQYLFTVDKIGRRTFLQHWQSRKRETLTHPFLEEKLPWGLVPYVQSLPLARYLRGDLDAYPPFLWK